MVLAFGKAAAIRFIASAKRGALRFRVAWVRWPPTLGATMQKTFAVPWRTYS